MITIGTTGTDIRVLERPHGGYIVQQGKSHLLLTVPETHQLISALETLLAPLAGHGGEQKPQTPNNGKPPIMRYPTTSRDVCTFVQSRPATVAHDVMDKFGLTHDAATKHLSRLHEAGFIRRPQHGVYTPLTAPQGDVLEGMD